jgi:L-glyceraldehyde 3-phosphate reductase
MDYIADKDRYQKMKYRRCGASGLLLPEISLGIWHNFGEGCDMQNITEIVTTAFDSGITHFDAANNYGPPPGEAEINFGKILKKELRSYRDEIIVSTKAGYYMWEGPYGEWGSKKYLCASIDQSLRRLQLDYVDIFYHHRPDDNTPLEETACALDLMVRQGKALYIGVSNYNAEQTNKITKIFKELKTPFIIHQARYNLLDRRAENSLIPALTKNNTGLIVFSPLAQGLLTERYFNGIPRGSRASISGFLKSRQVDDAMPKVLKLNEIAQKRGQTLSQMALAWLLGNAAVTSALVGVSTPSQLKENIAAIFSEKFSEEEINLINEITL